MLDAGILGSWDVMQRPTMGDRRKIRGGCGVQVQAGIGRQWALEHWKVTGEQRAGSLNKIADRHNHPSPTGSRPPRR